MEKRNIIIDCDPGHDDAIAILLAIAHKNLFNILGVTTVGGNHTVDKITENALKVLTIAEENIKVAKGAKGPLVQKLVTGEYAHGDTGMDGPILKEIKYKVYSENAVQFMYESILECKEKVTLVPMGPLTNIALLLTTYPEIKNKVELISLMGGGIQLGNVTATAEFNIYVDPEAAKIVFNSGVPIVMSGLDVTHKAYMTKGDIEKIDEDGQVSKFVKDLLHFYYESGKQFGFDVSAMHDPCAVVYLIDPTLFKGKDLHVDIEVKGDLTKGMTVADLRNITECAPNVKVLFDVNREKFVKLIYDALEALDKKVKK